MRGTLSLKKNLIVFEPYGEVEKQQLPEGMKKYGIDIDVDCVFENEEVEYAIRHQEDD